MANPEVDPIEAVYDALPRARARTEEIGPFTLFLRTDPTSWPYYARPRLGLASAVTTHQVDDARARQRELGAPETFEWVHDLCPTLDAAAEEAGLQVHRHPLMVLDGRVDATRPEGVDVRLLGPADDIARADAVAHVAFGNPGTATGEAGATERDAVAAEAGSGRPEMLALRIEAGSLGMAAAYDPELGPLSVGSYQCTPEGGEIVGVATLPAARRRGLGAAVTAVLVDDLRGKGIPLVFLSASDEDVARVYASVGFRRVGTACVAEPAG